MSTGGGGNRNSTIRVRFEAAVGQLAQAFQQVRRELNQLGVQAQQVSQQMQRSFTNLRTNLRSAFNQLQQLATQNPNLQAPLQRIMGNLTRVGQHAAGMWGNFQTVFQHFNGVQQQNNQLQQQNTNLLNQNGNAQGQHQRQTRQTTQRVQTLAQWQAQLSRQLRTQLYDWRYGMRNSSREVDFFANTLRTAFSIFAGKNLFDLTIGQAARFEQYEMQYEVLLGKAEAAKARVQELANFAIFSPSITEDILKADRYLQLFGIRTPEMLKVVGDAAAITGQQMEDVAFWMGRIASGDVGHGLLRLAEMGIVTTKELRDAGLEFTKNNTYVGDFNKLMNVMTEIVAKKFPDGMLKASQTATGLWSTLQDIVLTWGRETGFKALDGVKSTLNDLINYLWLLKKEGKFDKWGDQLAKAINAIIRLFERLAMRSEGIFDKIFGGIEWVADHFEFLTATVWRLLQVWLLWKAAVAIAGPISGLAMAIGGIARLYTGLTTAVTAAARAQVIFDIVASTNLVGLIAVAIFIVIAALYMFVNHMDWVKSVGMMFWEALKAVFWGILYAVASCVQGIGWFFQTLLGWIPGLGGAFDWLGSKINSVVDWILGKVAAASQATAAYASQVAGIGGLISGDISDKIKGTDFFKEFKMPGSGKLPKFTNLGSRGDDGSGGKGAKDNRDAIDKLEEEYKYKLDIADKKAQLHKDDANKSVWKDLINQFIGVLKGELSRVEAIMASASGELRDKAEAKKYEIMLKIQELTKQIKDNTAKLVNEFNVPGGVDATSLYQYRSGLMGGRQITLAGANFTFQIQAPPKSEQDLEMILDMAGNAVSNMLANRRRRG